MYNRKLWQDHVTEFENRFREQNNPDGTINHIPIEGTIIQQGTPQNAANFNNNEEGTVAANTIADYFMLAILQLLRGQKSAIGESGEITLTNTAKYPFNNSANRSSNTVALKLPRDTTNYTVTLEVQNEAGGAAGDLRILNKLRNGFLITYNGSASAVTVRYNVTGGSY